MKKNSFTEMPLAFTDKLSVQTLPLKGLDYSFCASSTELETLARNHNLLKVDNFSAHCRLTRWEKNGIKLKGSFSANFEQQCIISLNPIKNSITRDLSLLFVPAGSKFVKENYRQDTGEIFLDPEGSDLPEMYYNNVIEIGAILEEFFELALDPYPRESGAVFKYGEEEGKKDKNEENFKISPFEVLKKLKD